jgi:hypothetical protein
MLRNVALLLSKDLFTIMRNWLSKFTVRIAGKHQIF